MNTEPLNSFEQAAANQVSGNIVREFWDFLCQNKKWWLLPLLLIVVFLSVLTIMASSPAAPFIYSLF